MTGTYVGAQTMTEKRGTREISPFQKGQMGNAACKGECKRRDGGSGRRRKTPRPFYKLSVGGGGWKSGSRGKTPRTPRKLAQKCKAWTNWGGKKTYPIPGGMHPTLPTKNIPPPFHRRAPEITRLKK